jgi:hypothetical protein
MGRRDGYRAALIDIYCRYSIIIDVFFSGRNGFLPLLQNKQRGGEKLRIIEQVIGEETGIAVRIDTQEQRIQTAQVPQDDYSDILQNIQGDITWE